MAPRVRLYSMPLSHYCVAADRMLAFKGIGFATVRVPYHDKRELLRATGQDYVPALAWGRTRVPWTGIARYLDRVRPDPPLRPSAVAGEADLLQNWAHQVLEERVWRAVVTRIPRSLPDEVERWVFEEMQSRVRGPWHVLKARAPEFRREMLEYLGLVDRALEGRTWLLGVPSVADCAVYGAVSPLYTAGAAIPTSFRRLRDWHARVRGWGS